jgi:protein SCO1/2
MSCHDYIKIRFFTMSALRRTSGMMIMILAIGLASTGVLAHEEHQAESKVSTNAKPANLVKLQVPDLELTNQNGKKARLVSDYIGQRLVAFTFVYTTCTTVCPVIDGIFRKLQDRIGPDLGNEFALLTLTVNSAIDIPARLKEHSRKLGVKPGWDFLTGERETVKQVLKALEVYTPDIANHPPVVFVVDGRKGEWYRLNGFSSPELIEQTMRRQLAARKTVSREILHAKSE